MGDHTIPNNMSNQNKAGFLSTIFAILGILAYGVGALVSVIYVQSILTEPTTIEEGFGQIIVTLIFFIYAMGLALLGSILALFGKIWKQSLIVVVLSMIGLGIIILGLGVLTVMSFDSSDPTALGIVWLPALGMFFLHIKGLMNAM